jgi:hypothetical protein
MIRASCSIAFGLINTGNLPAQATLSPLIDVTENNKHKSKAYDWNTGYMV